MLIRSGDGGTAGLADVGGQGLRDSACRRSRPSATGLGGAVGGCRRPDGRTAPRSGRTRRVTRHSAGSAVTEPDGDRIAMRRLPGTLTATSELFRPDSANPAKGDLCGGGDVHAGGEGNGSERRPASWARCSPSSIPAHDTSRSSGRRRQCVGTTTTPVRRPSALTWTPERQFSGCAPPRRTTSPADAGMGRPPTPAGCLTEVPLSGLRLLGTSADLDRFKRRTSAGTSFERRRPKRTYGPGAACFWDDTPCRSGPLMGRRSRSRTSPSGMTQQKEPV